MQCQAYRNELAVSAVQCRLQSFPYLFIDIINRLRIGNIQLTVCPAHHIKIAMLYLLNLSAFHRDQGAAFGPGFANMSALDIAWKYNPWFLAHDFALMDVTQCPVLIAFGTQPIH